MDNSPKKRRGRRAYLNDFQPTAGGGYKYTGALYTYQGAEKPLRRALTELGLCCCLAACFIIVAGCLPAAGMKNQFYLLIPYACTFVSAISMVWAFGRLVSGKDPLREYVYLATVKKIPLRSKMTIILAGILLIAEIIHIVIIGFENEAFSTLIFILLIILTMTASWLANTLIHHMKWAK